MVGQVTLGTEDHVLLDAVQLLLCQLGVADEVQEPAVVLVHYAELLIKEVFDGVPGMEGVSVIDDGGGRRHPASSGLERLLLMLVPSKDYHGAQVQPVERGGHGMERRSGDHVTIKKIQITNCNISKTLIHSIHDSPTVFFSPHLYGSVNIFQSFQLVTLVQNLINMEMSGFLENGG